MSGQIRGDKSDSRGVKTIEHYHQKTADDNAPLHLADWSSIVVESYRKCLSAGKVDVSFVVYVAIL
ncbi:hypothetical protein ACLB1M_23715 [Escherichia coli]